MKLTSYAKINLGLRVLGLRPDGYHDIETIMQSIDLHDEIELEETAQGISLQCDHPLVPSDTSNLAWMSARLLQQTCGLTAGVHIIIRKTIPVGAGLGGGSSNAATVLRGLARLWKVTPSERDLFSMAARIGSDVPFFLKGGTALATGRGQNLDHLRSQWGETAFVLIYPRIAVSSGWAYGQAKISLTKCLGDVNLVGLIHNGSYSPVGHNALFANDLEEGVNCRYPVISLLRERLLSEGASVSAMTGSGSTVFGIFTTGKEAREAAHRIHHPEWDVYLARPINPVQEE